MFCGEARSGHRSRPALGAYEIDGCLIHEPLVVACAPDGTACVHVGVTPRRTSRSSSSSVTGCPARISSAKPSFGTMKVRV